MDETERNNYSGNHKTGRVDERTRRNDIGSQRQREWIKEEKDGQRKLRAKKWTLKRGRLRKEKQENGHEKEVD